MFILTTEMDPFITPFLLGHALSKGLDKSIETVRSKLHRMSQKRLQSFLETFCAEAMLTLRCKDDIELNDRINKLLSNEQAAEALFEIVRTVAMSRTRDLGPRVIAALGATILAEGRGASEDEELQILAAESLSDQQIGALVGAVQDAQNKAASSNEDHSIPEGGGVEYLFGKEQFDSNRRHDDATDIGPLNIGDALGRWAVLPKSLGLIEDDVRERNWSYSEDSEHHIDADGEVREIAWWIRFPKVTCDFVALIQRISVDYGKT